MVASELYLEQADTLAIVLPTSTVDRGWPNHVPLRGPELLLPHVSFALTEQPRIVTRDRFFGKLGLVDSATMLEIDRWLRDFLALP